MGKGAIPDRGAVTVQGIVGMEVGVTNFMKVVFDIFNDIEKIPIV